MSNNVSIGIYDVKARRLTTDQRSGLCSYMSFERLLVLLRNTGEVRSFEQVDAVEIMDGGIRLWMTTTGERK
jgi:hypothetical protein